MMYTYHAVISTKHWGSMGTAGADKVRATVLCAERDPVIGQRTAQPGLFRKSLTEMMQLKVPVTTRKSFTTLHCNSISPCVWHIWLCSFRMFGQSVCMFFTLVQLFLNVTSKTLVSICPITSNWISAFTPACNSTFGLESNNHFQRDNMLNWMVNTVNIILENPRRTLTELSNAMYNYFKSLFLHQTLEMCLTEPVRVLTLTPDTI